MITAKVSHSCMGQRYFGTDQAATARRGRGRPHTGSRGRGGAGAQWNRRPVDRGGRARRRRPVPHRRTDPGHQGRAAHPHLAGYAGFFFSVVYWFGYVLLRNPGLRFNVMNAAQVVNLSKQ